MKRLGGDGPGCELISGDLSGHHRRSPQLVERTPGLLCRGRERVPVGAGALTPLERAQPPVDGLLGHGLGHEEEYRSLTWQGGFPTNLRHLGGPHVQQGVEGACWREGWLAQRSPSAQATAWLRRWTPIFR